MRYLGIDVGRARIGVALADGLLRTARPLRVVERRGDLPDLAVIAQLAAEYEITEAVVGLPLNMDGSEGASAAFARRFAAKLGEALKVPVALQDERLSTFEAESRLRERGLSVKESRAQVDAEAAAVILQDWLDRSRE
jgi:putative Holliday junction resolvase